ncbi:Hypothetical protein, putative, partial [Bodo saltans]
MQPSAGGGGADDLSWWPSNGGGGAAVSRAAPAAAPSAIATVISSASQQPRSQNHSASPQIPPLVPSHSTAASIAAPLRGVGFGLDDLRKEFEAVMRQESPRRSPPRQHLQQPISAPAMSAATTALSTHSTHNHAAIPESRPALTVATTSATKNHHGQLSQVSPQRHHHVDSGYQSLYQPTVAPAMVREDPPHHASQYQHDVNTRTFASGAGPTTRGEGAALHRHSAGFSSASLQSTTASSLASDPLHRSARHENDSSHRSSSPQYTNTFNHKHQQQTDVTRSRLSRSPSGGRSGGGKDIHPWRSPLKQASSTNGRMSLLHASSSSHADPLLMGGGGAGASRTVRLEPMALTTRGSAPTTSSPYISVEPHAAAAATYPSGYSGAHTTTHHHHAAASTHHHHQSHRQESSHYHHDTHRAAPSPLGRQLIMLSGLAMALQQQVAA